MKTKLELAHEVVLWDLGLISSLDLKQIVTKAWEYADLMYEEAEKREPQGLPDVLKDKVSLTKDKEGNCLHLGQNFGQKKCMYCGVSLTNWQPDWSQSPSGFDWWAKDGFSNRSHWYNKEPFLDDEVDREDESQSAWNFILESNYTYTEAPSFNYQGDWKDSLRKRP